MIRDSKVKRITIVGLAALLTFTSGLGFVNASINATEEPLAGINITLDRFVASEASTGIISSIAMARGVEIASDEVISEEIPPIEEVDELAEEEVVEHVKLNLNYDRLGIAKVDTYLNIREKASTNSKIVGKLIKHAGCHIYSVKKGWAKIKSGNVTGYVKKEYLVMDEEAEEMAMEVGTKVVTVMTNGLRVRALPSVDASIYSVLAQDEDFEIYREKLTEAWMEKFIAKHSSKKQVKKIDYDSMLADLENWVCISVDSDYAFVSKEFVEISYKLNRAVAAGQIATDGSDGVSSTRASIVEYAKNFLGNRYVYGGTSLTNGTDCSGFTMRVFEKYGYGLPRTSGSQASSTRSVSGSDVRPGDLFFYANGGRVNHVALYIGSGMIIHASNPKSGIKISNAYYRQPYKIGRIIND